MTRRNPTNDDPKPSGRTAESEIVENLRNFRREAADSAARQLAALQEIERLLAQLMEE